MSRTLYSGNRNASSWAFRAWLALREQNIEFDEIIVDIRRPQRWKNLSEIGQFSPPAAVPVLLDGESVIYDSSAIMEYANELGAGELLPKDLVLRAQARSFVAWQHSTFSRVCPCLSFESAFYKEKKQLTANEIKTANWVYSIWEAHLTKSTGAYLFGDFSLADIALVPSVLRLKSHCPVSKEFPLTRRWVQQLLQREYVQEWLNQAYALDPIYCEGYYSS
ncbi:glutathione S-transferase family protein [Alginatibacterium sediminis]|uniref:Glutathione S-transferase family protein n=1 Tax=Alginatibacterium sediminis TaxID=2164068 RepID=A0A420E6Y6_9ALTE|nr:glutathione S-transferase family protein [Alginatibacterium sediminis]RKF13688.1 glutathione S-transferase family protein [Alginatibacterium sediminis]